MFFCMLTVELYKLNVIMYVLFLNYEIHCQLTGFQDFCLGGCLKIWPLNEQVCFMLSHSGNLLPLGDYCRLTILH